MNETSAVDFAVEQEPSTGFWQKIITTLHLDDLWNNIKNSQDTILYITIFAGIGIFLGFLLKRYGSFFITFALLLSCIVILAQFDLLLVSINWSKAYNLAGLPDSGVATSESFFLMIWDWIKNNVPLAVSFVVGFLIGLKIG
jgi:uncharacterized membrane protein (Fun14 family)